MPPTYLIPGEFIPQFDLPRATRIPALSPKGCHTFGDELDNLFDLHTPLVAVTVEGDARSRRPSSAGARAVSLEHIEALLTYVKADGRIYPMPPEWNELGRSCQNAHR